MPVNNPSSWQKQLEGIKDPSGKSQESYYSRAQDVYNFGFLLLLSAVGGLEFFESNDLVERIKIFLEEYTKKSETSRNAYCCIIHDEQTISAIKLNTDHKTSKRQEDDERQSAKHLSILEFLQASKFSKEFIDLLCRCLKFEPLQRATMQELKTHPFLKSKDYNGPNVTLAELIKISTMWTKNFVLPPEYQVASERQLDRVCEALSVVLPSSDRMGANAAEMREYQKLELLDSHSGVIEELAEDLGLPHQKVWERIQEVLRGINGPPSLHP